MAGKIRLRKGMFLKIIKDMPEYHGESDNEIVEVVEPSSTRRMTVVMSDNGGRFALGTRGVIIIKKPNYWDKRVKEYKKRFSDD